VNRHDIDQEAVEFWHALEQFGLSCLPAPLMPEILVRIDVSRRSCRSRLGRRAAAVEEGGVLTSAGMSKSSRSSRGWAAGPGSGALTAGGHAAPRRQLGQPQLLARAWLRTGLEELMGMGLLRLEEVTVESRYDDGLEEPGAGTLRQVRTHEFRQVAEGQWRVLVWHQSRSRPCRLHWCIVAGAQS